MQFLIIAVVGMLVIAAAAQLSERLGVASPLILLAVGALIGFLPVVPALTVPPGVVLEGVLPLLLFSAAVNIPSMDFRRELTGVAVLAVVLVAVTSLVLGFFLSWAVPGLPFAWAVAVGAVLSPTDAVATAIVRRSGVSSRIITILEGEGLLNDATALVVLSSAVSAATSGHITAGRVTLDFVLAVGVAVVIGWLVGKVSVRVRQRIDDAPVDTIVSFTVPFLAFVPAEHLHGSGLVAAVIAGLVTGSHGPRRLSPDARANARRNWRTVDAVLEGAIFLVMGLQLFGIVRAVGQTLPGLGQALWVAVVAGAIVIVVRALVVSGTLALLSSRTRRITRQTQRRAERLAQFEERLATISAQADMNIPATDPRGRPVDPDTFMDKVQQRLDHFRAGLRRANADVDYFSEQSLGPREGAVLVWAGMRGAVTLAAAQTLPLDAPYRPFLLLLAILVAGGSLVLQGLTLPAVVRWVRPAMHGAVDEEEKRRLISLLISTAKETAPDALNSLGSPRPDTEPGVRPTQEQLTASKDRALEVIRAQRVALLDARDEGLFSAQALGTALDRLDSQELTLTLSAGD